MFRKFTRRTNMEMFPYKKKVDIFTRIWKTLCIPKCQISITADPDFPRKISSLFHFRSTF